MHVNTIDLDSLRTPRMTANSQSWNTIKRVEMALKYLFLFPMRNITQRQRQEYILAISIIQTL